MRKWIGAAAWTEIGGFFRAFLLKQEIVKTGRANGGSRLRRSWLRRLLTKKKIIRKNRIGAYNCRLRIHLLASYPAHPIHV